MQAVRRDQEPIIPRRPHLRLPDEIEAARGYVAAGGGWYHFVSVRVTPTSFTYRTIDSAGVVRDSGWWAKGDAADRTLPASGAAGGR